MRSKMRDSTDVLRLRMAKNLTLEVVISLVTNDEFAFSADDSDVEEGEGIYTYWGNYAIYSHLAEEAAHHRETPAWESYHLTQSAPLCAGGEILFLSISQLYSVLKKGLTARLELFQTFWTFVFYAVVVSHMLFSVQFLCLAIYCVHTVKRTRLL